ncbi:hypothetical protein PGTUg99_036663 [Puccinia graminis f. sp. tritici]|uniref:Uncharacterized protein n=1 Tax=Puccinia graminis f. sp. tritici TaxID=56615 RepID=A0A5B0R9K7_PUCGR|nr:hypothetical protein PGTUg99_036663 [Puccinia graminis f. sp. tritici]
MKDFADEAYGTIILAHQTVTSGSFEDPQVKKFLHPSMVEFLQEKRERLLRSYSPSHLITWTKHSPAPEAGKKGKQAQPEKELEIVAMRAAPFDQGGTVVQIAVRFKSLQSLEIRDERGLLVFGSHSKPQPIMEVSLEPILIALSFNGLLSLLLLYLSQYFVFQKRMGQTDQSFRLLQQVDEDTKPDCLPV